MFLPCRNFFLEDWLDNVKPRHLIARDLAQDRSGPVVRWKVDERLGSHVVVFEDDIVADGAAIVQNQSIVVLPEVSLSLLLFTFQ